MNTISFKVVPAPEGLEHVVACFRLATYDGNDSLAVNVCPNGLPGIVLQQRAGQPVIRDITLASGHVVEHIPPLFIYGQVTEPSVMQFEPGPYTTLQVLLRPHVLHSIFGFDASKLTNGSMAADNFATRQLHTELVSTDDSQTHLALLTDFLRSKARQARPPDQYLVDSLDIVEQAIETVTVEKLAMHLKSTERQLQRRFIQSVGVTPQWYIRVRRFHKAMELMATGKYERLVDVAHALNFYDQSHFIRDIKAFSGVTPTDITQKVDEFYHDQVGTSFL